MLLGAPDSVVSCRFGYCPTQTRLPPIDSCRPDPARFDRRLQGSSLQDFHRKAGPTRTREDSPTHFYGVAATPCVYSCIPIISLGCSG
jgi:hypothetical protein